MYYKCKIQGTKERKECEDCFRENGKYKEYYTRICCQIINLDWIKQLKEIEQKGNHTQGDIDFLKLCKRLRFLINENGKWNFDLDYFEFVKKSSTKNVS